LIKGNFLNISLIDDIKFHIYSTVNLYEESVELKFKFDKLKKLYFINNVFETSDDIQNKFNLSFLAINDENLIYKKIKVPPIYYNV